MASVFTKILNGEIPCFKIAETENCFAFLDINPLSKGHTLVVPKKEIDNFFDLDDKLYNDVCLLSKKIAIALARVIPCERVCSFVIGLEVPHAHINLVPVNDMHDIDFSKPKLKLTQEEFSAIAKKIVTAL